MTTRTNAVCVWVVSCFGIVQVTVGDRACRVTSAKDSLISCVVGPGSVGQASVTVLVMPIGYASGSLGVVRDFTVTSLSPATGSRAGDLFGLGQEW